VDFATAAADAGTKAHDRIAVTAGQALNGADRYALSEGGDDLNLLIAGRPPTEAAYLSLGCFGRLPSARSSRSASLS
jgi:hypothetical protein